MTIAEEIKGMLAKARRYLASAKLLRQAGDFDSAVSRLYYSMFYGAEALLLSQEKTFSSHRAVIAAFGEHFCQIRTPPQRDAPLAAPGLRKAPNQRLRIYERHFGN